MREYRSFLLFALIAFAWAVTMTMSKGPVSFAGDEWRPVVISYFEPDNFEAIASIARDARRPAQGLHVLLLYRLFQFNDLPYRLTSNLLHALNCILWMWVILRTFPGKRLLALLCGVFALFFPTLTVLLGAYSYDGSRISMILYWISVLALQQWIISDQKWRRLAYVVLASLALLISLWTYENALLLIPVTLVFLWIAWRRTHPAWNRAELFRWGVAVVSIIMTYLFWWESRRRMRLTLQNDVPTQFLPEMGRDTIFGITKSFALNIGKIDIFVVVVIGILFLSLLYIIWAWRKDSPIPQAQRLNLLVVSLGLYGCGIVPYIIVQYGSHPRVYSVAIFGIILLIAWLITLLPYRIRAVSLVAICFVGALYLSSPFSRREQYANSFQARQHFYASLLQAVPQLDDEGRLVFLEDQPILIGSASNYRYMLRLFYNQPDLDYSLLTTYMPQQLDTLKWSTGRVTNEEITMPSGAILNRQGIVLVKATNTQFEALSEITPGDGVQLLKWDDGTPPIKSQTQHVIQTDENIKRLQKLGLLQATEP